MAAANVITAHLVVEFAEGDGSISAFVEVDDREFGFNGGVTRFLPGQPAYLLLFKPTGYSTIYAASSAGELVKHTDSVKAVEEYVTFPNQDSATVRYPINADFSYQWLGVNPGQLSRSGEFSVGLPARPLNPANSEPNPKYRIGVARLAYTANCEVWRLQDVDSAISQVLCFFVIKKDEA